MVTIGMADISHRVPDNAPGSFFVDSACINCGACRNLAPRVFSDNGDTSFVAAQPTGEEEEVQSFQALLACPVNAIGAAGRRVPPGIHTSFPLHLEDGVYLNGFNARSSFGADSYFIQDPDGNWMIDSPRFSRHLVERFHALGGIKRIFLTHRDDVADAARFAAEFGAERMIHERDAGSRPGRPSRDAEFLFRGTDDTVIGPARIIFTPGHTAGHAVLLWKDRFFFTGDHLPWSSADHAFRPFDDACWYSWPHQIRSVEKLGAHKRVDWVLPGHGERWRRTDRDFPSLIAEAVEWMRTRTDLLTP